ncbi:TPA: hypothetical protein SMI09_000196 [Serratia marcescens]|nr:hypothetical protein [Serratia marcescens]HEJ7252844.1 hypothetical protein [Serratia marcescens]HEJ7909140.1 hypothetical protein [Serratia marcescens]HEJ7929264.1 hypothetical protein [Serratia marcescens]HEJ7956901.1 hypothetical protein [Serratia marcescens]
MTLTTERQQFEQWWHEEYCHLEGSSEAAFVKHVAWEAMQKARELLANREAQPVAWASTASLKRGDVREVWPNGEQHKAGKLCITALYTAPPAPAVPEEISTRQAIVKMDSHEPCDSINVAYKLGWNACRAAMLAAAPEGGNDHDTRR